MCGSNDLTWQIHDADAKICNWYTLQVSTRNIADSIATNSSLATHAEEGKADVQSFFEWLWSNVVQV